jgi:hypothetical protein
MCLPKKKGISWKHESQPQDDESGVSGMSQGLIGPYKISALMLIDCDLQYCDSIAFRVEASSPEDSLAEKCTTGPP